MAKPADYIKVPLSRLRVGTQLHAPIFDALTDREQLLLAAGVQLTASRLDLLKRRGISHVYVHQSELDRIAGYTVRPAAERMNAIPVKRFTATRAVTRGSQTPAFKIGHESFLQAVQRPRQLECNPNVLRSFEQKYESSLSTTQNLFEEFSRDQRVNPAVITCIAEQQLDQVAQDLDLYVSLSVAPVTEGYPSRHSLQTSMLAVSMGTVMGLSKDALMGLSFGCLLHDAGLMLVPKHILEHAGPLSPVDRHELVKHPIHIANALSRRNDIPSGAKMAAFQMHERLNGSGYPRQRHGHQIHPFAKIGAVADTYLALVSPRYGREGLSPYEALEKLLYATKVGLFDSASVRALLHAVSLFPVGSSVTLNDGRTGRVSRTNREQYDRPIIEVLSDNDEFTTEIVDLSQHQSLRIVSAGELAAV